MGKDNFFKFIQYITGEKSNYKPVGQHRLINKFDVKEVYFRGITDNDVPLFALIIKNTGKYGGEIEIEYVSSVDLEHRFAEEINIERSKNEKRATSCPV